MSADLRPVCYLRGVGPRPDDPAENHHEAAKLDPDTAPAHMGPGAALLQQPEVVDETTRVATRRGAGPTVALPDPRPLGRELGETLAARRTSRSYAPRAIALGDAATLLAAAYRAGPGTGGRPVPSGGALFPLELFCVAQRVEGLAPGLWHYDARRHQVQALDRTPRPTPIDRWFIEAWPPEAAVVVVVAAAFWRSRFKYGQRGYRFALLEAGHVGQNLQLVATALGLASAAVGGFWDRHVDEDLGLDGVDESVVHTVVAGHPA
jgi:SagB-type dehydrogenase family enzyme